jgi:hypothetical protein
MDLHKPTLILRLFLHWLPQHTKPGDLLIASVRHHVESYTIDFFKAQLSIQRRASFCGNQECPCLSYICVLEADIHQLFP